MIGGPVNYVLVLKGTTVLAALGLLLVLVRYSYAFPFEVSLFSFVKISKFDERQAYLAYHHSFKMDLVDDVCVGRLSYVHSSGEVLGFLPSEFTFT